MTHEEQILALTQERDTLQRLLKHEQLQNREQLVWRARDQKELAQILGLDPFDPQNTIPALHRAVERAVEDARSWRQAQRKR